MAVIGTWNLENLFCPGTEFGPKDEQAYRDKLASLAATINAAAPDILGVEEVGDPDALHDLVELLDGTWHTAVSSHFEQHHPIRVAVISRHPLETVADVAAFPHSVHPVQVSDSGAPADSMGRGVLAVRADVGGTSVVVAACHLKSKLLTYPSTGGRSRFGPKDEGERARYGAYALYRRTAEAATVRCVADDLVAGAGTDRAVVVLGDLNDEPQAATTQILYGPPGAELGGGTPPRADTKSAHWRLWNLAPLIPQAERFSRVYHSRGELIDHILVSRALVDHVEAVHIPHPDALPSVGDDPKERRDAPASDHSPVLATFDF